MPSIVSFGKGSTTGIDLSANSFWRLTLGAASATEMALVVLYPAASYEMMLAKMNRIALAKVEVNIAKQADEIENVAQVALQGGTLDLDISRVTEAMNLFRMHARTKEEAFEQSLTNVLTLVRGYLALRSWLELGAGERLTHDIGSYRLKCDP